MTMKKLWPLLLRLIPFQSIHAQEVQHTPTVSQCRADQNSWLAKMMAMDIADVSYKELIGRLNEMGDCARLDPERYNDYLRTQALLGVHMSQRETNFIHRHNLWDQFLAEDAQGKR
jgi:hypothetical protein